MKVNSKQITEAIKQEALRIKKSKEIYQKALQLNEEVKKINEMHGMGFGLGPGFTTNGNKNPQVIGIVSNRELNGDSKEDLNTIGNLKDLFNLDKEMVQIDNKKEESKEELINKLSQENEKLKAKLEKIANETKEN